MTDHQRNDDINEEVVASTNTLPTVKEVQEMKNILSKFDSVNSNSSEEEDEKECCGNCDCGTTKIENIGCVSNGTKRIFYVEVPGETDKDEIEAIIKAFKNA